MSGKIIENADDLLLDVLHQACFDDKHQVIDNLCMSAYESACKYLTLKGLLIEVNTRMYKLVETEVEIITNCVDCNEPIQIGVYCKRCLAVHFPKMTKEEAELMLKELKLRKPIDEKIRVVKNIDLNLKSYQQQLQKHKQSFKDFFYQDFDAQDAMRELSLTTESLFMDVETIIDEINEGPQDEH